MTLETKYRKFFRDKFLKISSKEEIVELLNEANKVVFSDDAKKISLKKFTYFANYKFSKNRYSSFQVNKKSGGKRIIHSPEEELKNILRPLNFILQCVYEPNKAANGFVKGRSVVTNAQIHVGNYYIFNIDLKDFFFSFDRNIVKLAFMRKPFNFNKEREPIAFLLACLCTHPIEINGEEKIVLPQGSPTSPIITNILCNTLDRRLNGLAKRFGVKYSRYADDISFSANHNIFNNKEFLNEMERIIKEQNLQINQKKVRLNKSDYRQEVTGLVVNEKVNVKRRYIKQVRMWLYYWEKYGYDKASDIFLRDYAKDKGHVKNIAKAKLSNVLYGKLLYLKMVKGEKDGTYKKLKERYDKLTNNKKIISEILDIWEQSGIENAMKVFYSKYKHLLN